ncbi:MAG: hypothetical protein N3A02_05910, partial [Rectinema sp.]|nr:hypothetical protein [Rectinema sp.]
IFESELDLYLVRMRQHVREKDRNNALYEQKKHERDQLVARIERMSEAMSEGLDLVNELEARLVDKQKVLYGLAVEKNGKEKQRTILIERSRELDAKIAQLEARDRTLVQKIESLQDEEGEREAEYAGYRARIREVDANIHSFEESINAAALAVKANEETLRRNASEAQEIEAKTAELRKSLDGITERIAELVDQRLRESESQIEARQNLEESIRLLVAELGRQVSTRASLLDDLSRVIPAMNPQEASKRLWTSVEDLRNLETRIHTLSEELTQYFAIAPTFLNELVAPGGVMTQKRRIDAQIAHMASRLQEIATLHESLQSRNADLSAKIEQYRKTLENARLEKTKIQTQMEAAQDALAMLRREIAGQEAYRREIMNELAGERRRVEELKEEIDSLESELAEIERKGRQLTSEMAELEESIRQRSADLEERRTESANLERQLAVLQQEIESAHMGIAQCET